MKIKRMIVVGFLALILFGLSAFVLLNWEAVSRNLGKTITTQSERVTVTLFRLGELMSIEAHAREIAAFAVRQTKKSREIDLVRLSFIALDGESDVDTFRLEELLPEQQFRPGD